MSKPLHLTEIDADLGGGIRGSGLGISALRNEAWLRKHPLYEGFDSVSHLHLPSPSTQQSKLPKAKFIDILLAFYKQHLGALTGILGKQGAHIICSGDHSNAIFILAALQKAYPRKHIGIVWIDAHADLHTPYSTPSGNMHGMSLGVYFNTLSATSKRAPTKITLQTQELWQELCSLHTHSKSLDPRGLVYVGLRDYEESERQVITQKGIKVYTPQDISTQGVRTISAHIIKQLSEYDLVYISFDVDALDSRISQGTGTPVSGGLSDTDVEALITSLIKHLPVRLFEITEINPLLDHKNKMAKTVFPLLTKACKLLSHTKK